MYLFNSLFRVQSNEKNCNLPKFFAKKYLNKCIFYPFRTKCRRKRPIYRQEKRGYHTISSRQPLEILHICYQIVHYILFMYARELLLFNNLTTLFYGLHIQRNQIVVTFRQCLLQRLLNTRCTYDGSNLQQSA